MTVALKVTVINQLNKPARRGKARFSTHEHSVGLSVQRELEQQSWTILSSFVVLISLIRSKIFYGVVANQPGKSGKHCGEDPF